MSVRINNKLVASNARQTNSDWNATTGGAAILNKPTNLVHTTDNETISGDKTFENKILLNSPSYSGPQGFIYQGESTGPLFIGLQNSSGSFSNNVIYLYQNAQTLIKSTTNVQLEGTTPATTNAQPTEDTTSSTQIDTVGARNTKLANYALDNSVVHLTGDESIAGTKTFTGDYLQVKSTTENVSLGLRKTSTTGQAIIIARDGDDNNAWRSGIYFNNQNDSSTHSINIITTSLTGPTPTEDTTSSTQIDTVGARNTKLANYALDNNTVHKSGDETISGQKTFTSHVIIKNGGNERALSLMDNDMDIYTNPSSYILKGLYIEDKNQLVTGSFVSQRTAQGSQIIEICSTTAKSDNSGLINSMIKLQANRDGTASTYAPTPASNSNDNNIATTAWCNNSSNDLVHKSGTETITGQKTFDLTVKLNQIQSTGTGTESYPHINFIDMNGGPSLGGKGAYVAIEDGTAGQWNKIATVQGNNTFTGVNTFNQTVQGTAYRALYADLAEYYEMDMKYPTGTLVQFGGLNEMTIASTKVNAVISENPAFIMNGKETENSQPVALIGKVKIRVEGKVNKFDKLTLSENPGIAKVSTNENDVIIGRALESKDFEEESLVLSSVKINLG